MSEIYLRNLSACLLSPFQRLSVCLSVYLSVCPCLCLIEYSDTESETLSRTQAFTATSIVLIESVGDHRYSSQAMLVCGTLTGYAIICATLGLGHLVGANIDKRIDVLFSVAAVILFISSGAVILDRWLDAYEKDSDKNSVLAAAIFCLTNGAIFVGDTFVVLNA
ncbi:uncharacterized protein LOC117891831 [Drosophila subobscura]|uniref:uncharacterized protein LOC117891831 n=1 Tax=Drosophila subobscura TaxID=7241 RepID=UPI00155A58E9|nr:uncharacterized protein LOC117891831 [Drosophila subobscura]